jgi:hypothetical protein
VGAFLEQKHILGVMVSETSAGPLRWLVYKFEFGTGQMRHVQKTATESCIQYEFRRGWYLFQVIRRVLLLRFIFWRVFRMFVINGC